MVLKIAASAHNIEVGILLELTENQWRVGHDGEASSMLQSGGNFKNCRAPFQENRFSIKNQFCSLRSNPLLLLVIRAPERLIRRLEVRAGGFGDGSSMGTDEQSFPFQSCEVAPDRGRCDSKLVP